MRRTRRGGAPDPRRKARKLANARNLAALANDTKWGEFFAEVERLRIPLQVKLLYEDEAFASTWVWVPVVNYVDSGNGPELFVFVEWVRSRNLEDVAGLPPRSGSSIP